LIDVGEDIGGCCPWAHPAHPPPTSKMKPKNSRKHSRPTIQPADQSAAPTCATLGDVHYIALRFVGTPLPSMNRTTGGKSLCKNRMW
jgi:hypothetical protein